MQNLVQRHVVLHIVSRRYVCTLGFRKPAIRRPLEDCCQSGRGAPSERVPFRPHGSSSSPSGSAAMRAASTLPPRACARRTMRNAAGHRLLLAGLARCRRSRGTEGPFLPLLTVRRWRGWRDEVEGNCLAVLVVAGLLFVGLSKGGGGVAPHTPRRRPLWPGEPGGNYLSHRASLAHTPGNGKAPTADRGARSGAQRQHPQAVLRRW